MTPPYLSVKKIAEMMELVSSRNYRDGISVDFFKSRRFGSADALLAVNTLKFLNLLTEDGKPTEFMTIMRIKGDDRKPEFEKVLRNGYKKLFETVDEPHLLSRDKLKNEFVAIYDVSDRVLASAIPAFYKFCEYAGLMEERPVPMRSVSLASQKSTERVRKTGRGVYANKSTESDPSLIKVAIGKIEVTIPKTLMNAILNDSNDSLQVWVKVKSALKELEDLENLAPQPQPEAPDLEQ